MLASALALVSPSAHARWEGTLILSWRPMLALGTKKASSSQETKMGWVQWHHHFDCCILVPGAWAGAEKAPWHPPLAMQKRVCQPCLTHIRVCAGVKQMKWGGNWISSFIFFNVACILIHQKPARPLPEACRPLAMQKWGSIPSFSCLWQVLTAALEQDSILLERRCLFFVSERPCLPRTR